MSIDNEESEDVGEERPSVNDEVGREVRATGTKFQLTMEVPFFCMFLAIAISGAVINNMLLERACRRVLRYNETVCAELQRPGKKTPDMERLEGEVQAITTVVLMAKSVLEGFFPAVLSLFLGVWSNTHGRKPLVTWPLLGFALSMILVTGYSLVGGLSPWWFVVTSLPFSLGGGGSALFTGAFCYLSDITTPQNRSFRLAMLEASLFVGSILGSLASPYTVDALGTPCLLLLTATLAVAAYVYTNLWIEESVEGAVEGGLGSVLDVSLVKDMVRTCFKRRPNYERGVLFLLVMANSLSIFILYGLSNIDYLYAREKLSWSLQDYSVFSAVNTVVMVGGLLFGVGVMQNVWRIQDLPMTMVSYVSCAAEMLLKALATAATGWLMYFSSGISLLRGLCSPLIRSVISKRVAADDMAKVFALMSALEAILPVFSPIVYNTLYKYTLLTVPGAVYYMTLGVYTACLFMVCVAHYFMVKYPTPQYSTLES